MPEWFTALVVGQLVALMIGGGGLLIVLRRFLASDWPEFKVEVSHGLNKISTLEIAVGRLEVQVSDLSRRIDRLEDRGGRRG